MHFPLILSLRPTLGVLAPVLAVHLAAALALFLAVAPRMGVPADGARAWAPLLLVSTGWALIAWSLRAAIRHEFAKRDVVLVLRADGALAVERAGRVEVFQVAEVAVDFGWAAWLPLRREARPADRVWRLMLVPANLPPGRWRHFRIWLRHKTACTGAH